MFLQKLFHSILPSSLLLLAAVSFFGCTREGLLPEEKPVGDLDLLDYCIVIDGKEYPATGSYGNYRTVFVPDGTSLSKLVAKFRCNETTQVTVGGVPQESGVTTNSFLSVKRGVVYHLAAKDGKSKDYTVYVLDTRLPVVSINTESAGAIKSREDWRESSALIRKTDGTVENLGASFIRGRGNYTWTEYPKKPYALKLEHKHEILGMPAHKRWDLLALYRGFIGNAMAFEATRRAPSMKWAPRGQYVELVLNGKYQGLYYLCEHIKIDNDRVDIKKLKTTDNEYPAVSGGYLLEYDELYDEKFKFKSASFRLPVQIKDPNDSLTTEQYTYIKTFINDMEAEIKKIGTSEESHYADYLDMNNFADYWMILETVNNYEAYKPRSVKMYKGRDGVDSPNGTVCKLKAGPLWDQELFLVDHEFNSRDMYYYKYLFRDPAFVAAVKERWPVYKSNILGNSQFKSYLDYMNDIAALIDKSAKRDITFWGNDYFTLQGEVSRVRKGFLSKIEWMDAQINAMQ